MIHHVADAVQRLVPARKAAFLFAAGAHDAEAERVGGELLLPAAHLHILKALVAERGVPALLAAALHAVRIEDLAAVALAPALRARRLIDALAVVREQLGGLHVNPCAALLRFRPGKAKFREARPVAAHVDQPGSVRRSPHGDRRDALHNADRREETACERAGRRLHLLRRVPARAIRTGGIPARPLQRGVIILAAIPVLEDNRALGPAPGAVGKGSRAAGAVLSGDFQLGNELLPPGDPRFHKAAVILLVAVRREQRAVRQAAHDGVELEIRVLAVAKHNADRVGPLAQQACHVISDIVDGARRVTFAGIEQRIGERRAVERSAEQPQAAHIEARVIHFPERRLEIAGEQRRGGGIALPAVPLADP